MPEELYPKPDERQQDVALKKRSSNWRNASCLMIFAVVWSAISFPVMCVVFRRPQPWWSWFFLIFPLFGVALLTAAFVIIVRAALLAYRFGKAGAVVSVLPAYPGETVRVAAGQLFKIDTPINAARLELRCDEWVRWRRGTDTCTETRSVFQQTRVFDESAVADGHIRLAADFTIPPEAMHSFHAQDNRVEWILSLHVDVPGWPDPKHEFVYLVAPRRAGEPVRTPPAQPKPKLHHQTKALVSLELRPGPFGDSYRYFLGEAIQGTVIVSSPQELRCRGVYVQLGWHTSGKGTPDGHIVWHEYVHRGPLPAGESKFSFQTALPDGPASYDGELLAVNWHVCAWVDLPWARDPGCEWTIWAEMPAAT